MLKDKKCLITGAVGDIGMAMCDLLLKNNAHIFITGRNDEKLEEFANKMKKKYNNAVIFYENIDLIESEKIDSFIEHVNDKLGRIDIFIGNAGIAKDNLMIKMDNKNWNDVINVNLTSNFILCKNVLKIMIKQKCGKIINISSVIGLTGNIGQVNYSASKAGLIAMTKTIALEYAGFGITANCIAPGFIDTSMTKHMSDEAKNKILNKIPLKRYGKPIDVANAVIFLSSDMGNYITGETICVNGGLFMK